LCENLRRNQQRAACDNKTKKLRTKNTYTTSIDQAIEQLQQLLSRIEKCYVMGTRLMVVSRYKMLEAVEQQLAILEDEESRPSDKSRAQLIAEILIRIAGNEE